MNPSAPDLIRAVAQCLARDILPRFETANWTASNVRSCLALLAHLEDRVASEGPMLHVDNQRLRDLLGEAARAPGVAAGLAADIDAALAAHRADGGYPPVAELAAANDAYRDLLERYIAGAAALRRAAGASRTPLDEAIRAHLIATAPLDFAPMARAAAMPAI
jgi:hypothetical protein